MYSEYTMWTYITICIHGTLLKEDLGTYVFKSFTINIVNIVQICTKLN